MYLCSATCIPSCEFTWKYTGKTSRGVLVQRPILDEQNNAKYPSQLEMTFSDYSKIEPLTHEATNSVSHATITTTENLTVIGGAALFD